MAKTKKLKNVISEEHLEKINSKQTLLSDITQRIGIIETEKHSLLHRIAEVNKDIEEVKLELEKEYGQVTIDLKTGEYKPLEKQNDAVEHP